MLQKYFYTIEVKFNNQQISQSLVHTVLRHVLQGAKKQIEQKYQIRVKVREVKRLIDL